MAKKIIDEFSHLSGKAAWRKRHPEHARKIVRATAGRRRRWLQGLKDKPCVDCGGTFPPVCMDFDHVRGKKLFSIGPNSHVAEDRVLKEIAKCDLVCSNCHRIRTARRAGWQMPSKSNSKH